MQPRVFGFVNNAHPAATKLLHNAVVRDCLPDHAQECYGGSMRKSTKPRVGHLGLLAKNRDYANYATAASDGD
jgi:hypothetical protein